MSESDSSLIKKPLLLTPVVILMLVIDLLGFVDVESFLSKEFAFYFLLSLLMLPIYYALYKGKNWSRLVLLALSLLALISSALNASAIIPQYSTSTWRLVIFFFELTGYLCFVIFSFWPSVRRYFYQQVDGERIEVSENVQIATLLRRFFSLLLDLFIASLLFFGLYMLALKVSKQAMYFAAFIPFLYLAFMPYSRFAPGRLILGVSLVNLSLTRWWPFFAFLRLIYAVLLLPINIFFVLFDPYSRGVHDYICSTLVVSKK